MSLGDSPPHFVHIDFCSCNTSYGDNGCICPGVEFYRALVEQGLTNEDALKKALWEDDPDPIVFVPLEVYKRSSKTILI